MQKAADCLKKQCQSQLELTLNLCNLGLECCERLTEINGQSARALLTQAGTDSQSWLRGDTNGLMVGTTQTVLDHWGSMLACYAVFQRQVLTGLAKK